jgi:hypothetical protein
VTACANGCSAPAPRGGPTVPTCGTTQRGDLRTESYYAARRRRSCQGWNGSTPIVCGNVPDCCSGACQRPIPASPASCNAAP